VRSIDSKQLAGDNVTSSACQPLQYVNSTGGQQEWNWQMPDGGAINPCGLIAWSYFNDTFTVLNGKTQAPIDVRRCLSVCLSSPGPAWDS
jgi:LEM3 (ligand-effect modulator 3) family / CDC50 family